MARHQVPRWMNVLWLVFIVSLTGLCIVIALWRGYNLVQTIGFFALNFGTIFSFAVLAGLILYAFSFLLGRANQRKLRDDDEEDHIGDMANLVSCQGVT